LSDTLVHKLQSHLKDGNELSLGKHTHQSSLSPSTIQSIMHNLFQNSIRREGKIIRGQFLRKDFEFSEGMHHCENVAYPELSTCYHTSKIENITTFMSSTRFFWRLFQWLFVIRWIFHFMWNYVPGVQFFANIIVAMKSRPSEESLRKGFYEVSAKLTNGKGNSVHGRLFSSPSVYVTSANLMVMGLKNLLRDHHSIGVLLPLQAFGEDFIQGDKNIHLVLCSEIRLTNLELKCRALESEKVELKKKISVSESTIRNLQNSISGIKVDYEKFSKENKITNQ
jgi:short subunit dehydrogenase-like uncharacterized protein